MTYRRHSSVGEHAILLGLALAQAGTGQVRALLAASRGNTKSKRGGIWREC